MFAEWKARPIEEGASKERTVSIPGMASSFADADGVIYKTTFDDPRNSDEEVAVLELSGLYAHSEIELTGTLLADEGPVEHDTYFEPLSIPFEPAAETENELVVTCHAPSDRFGGVHDTSLVPDDRAVPGIWWDATLDAREPPYIESIDVRPDSAGSEVTLQVSLTVVADEPLDESVTYSLKPEGELKARGMMQRASVEMDGPGRQTFEHTVEAMDPSFWWPRGMGEQNRYLLRAKLADDERTITTGICDVRFEDGSLVVNDELVPIRGINLLSSDPADVERAIDCNANLLRAHAHVLPETVYEVCDREGILIWQDLPLTGVGEFDVDRGKALVETLSGLYTRHPSLAAVGIHDDPVDAFGNGLGSGLLDRLRLRWRAWRSDYDSTAATEVASAVPDGIPVFPVVGGPGVDTDAASYYPGWLYGRPDDIDSLLARYPADVVAEFGSASLTTEDGDDGAGFDRSILDRHANGVDASQEYQAVLLRTIIERLRTGGIGAIPFCLRDLDSAGMGVYTEDGSSKPARDAIATAFEPTQAFLADPDADSSKVVVVNDRPQGMTGTLQWEAGDKSGDLDLTLSPQGVLTGEPIPLPADAAAVSLRLVTDRFTIENTYER